MQQQQQTFTLAWRPAKCFAGAGKGKGRQPTFLPFVCLLFSAARHTFGCKVFLQQHRLAAKKTKYISAGSFRFPAFVRAVPPSASRTRLHTNRIVASTLAKLI